MLETIILSDSEKADVRSLVGSIIALGLTTEIPLLDAARFYAEQLPSRLKALFYEFKLRENCLGIIVSNNPLEDSEVGPTPQRHRRPGEDLIGRPHILHGLYSSLLGESIGFETQQNGHIFNDVIPIADQRSVANSSAGSDHRFDFHTEDCFHPFMPDYIGLMCLRNEEQAITYVSSLWGIELPARVQKILWDELFFIKPNPMHRQVEVRGFSQKRSILFGDFRRPYLRVNSALVTLSDYDTETAQALQYLFDTLEANRREVLLRQGDCLYLDNFFAVHAREAYVPNYGPRARWLCRLVMARDLRKSRALRSSSEGRVIKQYAG